VGPSKAAIVIPKSQLHTLSAALKEADYTFTTHSGPTASERTLVITVKEPGQLKTFLVSTLATANLPFPP